MTAKYAFCGWSCTLRNIAFENVKEHFEFWCPSSLFHLLMTDGKEVFFQEAVFNFEMKNIIYIFSRVWPSKPRN